MSINGACGHLDGDSSRLSKVKAIPFKGSYLHAIAPAFFKIMLFESFLLTYNFIRKVGIPLV